VLDYKCIKVTACIVIIRSKYKRHQPVSQDLYKMTWSSKFIESLTIDKDLFVLLGGDL